MKLSIIPAAFDCLRKGESLANPGLWKVGGMALSAAVGGFALSLNALAKAAGYDLHIDPQTADAFGAVAAWFIGSLFHVATTGNLGILSAKPVPAAPPYPDASPVVVSQIQAAQARLQPAPNADPRPIDEQMSNGGG